MIEDEVRAILNDLRQELPIRALATHAELIENAVAALMRLVKHDCLVHSGPEKMYGCNICGSLICALCEAAPTVCDDCAGEALIERHEELLNKNAELALIIADRDATIDALRSPPDMRKA